MEEVEKAMSSSAALLRWLCWALIVFVVASAILTIGISLNVLVNYPNTAGIPDFVNRIAAIRAADQQALTVLMISNLVGIGVFVLAALLGVVLRSFAAVGAMRDLMATVFIVGATIGIVGQLFLLGLNQAAAQGYCDCGYKAEELVGQAKALDMGFAIQTWLALAALLIVGVGVAIAGRLLNVSAAWRTLAYVIAILLVIAAVLFVVNQGNLGNSVTGIAAVLVAVWAFMLARAIPSMPDNAPVTGV
jgi:hypothetical protein